MSASEPRFIPLEHARLGLAHARERARAFLELMQRRRTTRHFSREPVPRDLIETAIRTAGTAPSGAHQQPWTFVAIGDPALKAAMREAAELEERENYATRMTPEWRAALAPLGTDANKPHITDAPWIIVLFRQAHGRHADGSKRTHYYSQESCGIAAGLLIAALHNMGLVTLTHTPSPMGFLSELLGRPSNEKAFLLMPVGYPAAGALVPAISRKELNEISAWHAGPTSTDAAP